MKAEKAKYSWHYYVMAAGALMAMLAGTLGSVGGIVSGISFSDSESLSLPLKLMTRFAFMVVFVTLYVFSFPDPEVVRELMASQHAPMVQPSQSESMPVSEEIPSAAPIVESVATPSTK